MAGKAVISLSTGLEDPEKVTVAFLVAVGAAGSGRPTDVPGQGSRPARAGRRGGGHRLHGMVCPVSFNAKQLDQGGLLPNAELAGSVQLWEWIGDEGATTFSY